MPRLKQREGRPCGDSYIGGDGFDKLPDIGLVPPTPPETKDAARDTLSRFGALDLAEMLGLDVEEVLA